MPGPWIGRVWVGTLQIEFSMPVDILVIIPTYGHFDYAREVVRSLLRSTDNSGISVQYVVIDDASREWSEVDWRQWPNDNFLKLRFCEHGGLTRSWNAGLRMAVDVSAKYAVCTNSDILFSEGWFTALIATLESGVALVGPVTNAPGDATWQNVSAFCDPSSSGVVPDDSDEHVDAIARILRELQIAPLKRPINGFFMMAKTGTWWRGAFDSESVFDPTIPLGGNELELQRRWSVLGLQTAVVPQSYIFHYRSVSRPDGLIGSLGLGAFRRI